MTAEKPAYKRVLLKLSGEGLMGSREYGLDPVTVGRIADEIKAVTESGVEVCLVIGGGNIFRGVSGAAAGMERASADYMGMLATVINALAMQNALEQRNVQTGCSQPFRCRQSASPTSGVAQSGIWKRAGLSFSEPEQVIRFSPRTPPPPCAPPK